MPKNTKTYTRSFSTADKAVIVFLRAPEPGRVKTRLARTLAKDFVLRLYKAFVQDTLDAAGASGSPVICFTPDDKEKQVSGWLGNEYRYLAQKGRDLGERMANAFEAVFQSGYDKAVLVGTDIPQLTASLLSDAFDCLNRNRVALGPALDGGYYLIGFCKSRLTPTVFENIIWSGSRVLEQTRAVMDKNRVPYQLLETLNDIDTCEDLEKLMSDMSAGGRVGKQTRLVLRQYGADISGNT